jgi:hypothetical protein
MVDVLGLAFQDVGVVGSDVRQATSDHTPGFTQFAHPTTPSTIWFQGDILRLEALYVIVAALLDLQCIGGSSGSGTHLKKYVCVWQAVVLWGVR